MCEEDVYDENNVINNRNDDDDDDNDTSVDRVSFRIASIERDVPKYASIKTSATSQKELSLSNASKSEVDLMLMAKQQPPEQQCSHARPSDYGSKPIYESHLLSTMMYTDPQCKQSIKTINNLDFEQKKVVGKQYITF